LMAIPARRSAMSANHDHEKCKSQKSCDMRIFLAGVSCVGKTTVGSRLADLLCCPFFDLDLEIEAPR
jgi:adenylylsulfate kinase-like enzyme